MAHIKRQVVTGAGQVGFDLSGNSVTVGGTVEYECEERGHVAADDAETVREYRVLDDVEGERYSRWLCYACARRLEAAGVDMKGVPSGR